MKTLTQAQLDEMIENIKRKSHIGAYSLEGYELKNLRFDEADLSCFGFAHSRICNCSFRDCDLRLADFTCCEIELSVFRKAQLDGACFSDAHINCCEFRRSNLSLANFCHAVIANSDFYDAKLDEAFFQSAAFSIKNIDSKNAKLLERWACLNINRAISKIND